MKLDKYIGYILFIAAVIGWGVSYGIQQEKINAMQEDQNYLKEFVQQQIEINAKITFIISNMDFTVNSD